MAEVIKSLARATTVGAATTVLYTVPPLTKATISVLTIDKLSSVANARLFINHILSGDVAAAKNLLCPGIYFGVTPSDFRIEGLACMDAGDVLTIDNSAESFTYNLYGSENDSSDENVPKNLGQLAPVALTASTLYTVPLSKVAVLSLLNLCNYGSARDVVQVAMIPSAGSLTANKYIVNNLNILGLQDMRLNFGITMTAGDLISVYSTTGSSAFGAYGTEFTP